MSAPTADRPAPLDPATEKIHDLLIVGAGSVGLTLAAVWSQLGREAVLVERHEQQYGLPRAGHIDHEIMRLLQSVDAEAPVVDDAYETAYYRWVNADGETLLDFPWGEEGVSGWHSDFMQNSAILEASLLDRVKAGGGVQMLDGWQAQEVYQRDDHVELVLARVQLQASNPVPQPTGERRVLLGRYLVGCDGAGSGVRRAMAIDRDDLGFNEKWLVVDARKKRVLDIDFDSGQICDPRRPTTILPLGKHHRRWEWHIAPQENPADFARPEKVWELLADLGVTPDDVDPVRQLVYTFEARTALQWRKGRVLLAGDAAHTMPPFMGQGMCSGMRDAKNLAWKLDLVVRGIADDALLDSYERERRPHVADWTTISLESGRLSCVTDPEEARQRDAAFRAGFRPPIPEFPQLVTGVLNRDDDGKLVPPAGELGVQGRVTLHGRTDLFDRLVPDRRFIVLSLDRDPLSVLDQPQQAALDALGTVAFQLHSPEDAADPAFVVDVDHTYATWMAERGIRTVVMRPDFYVFGGVSDLDDLPTLVGSLLIQTHVHVPSKAGEDHAVASRR